MTVLININGMNDKSKTRIEEFGTCITSMKEVSETAKETVVKELKKIKGEIQDSRVKRKKRTKKA